MSIFGVILVCIFQHSDWIGEKLRTSPHSVQMLENTDQNNSEYGHFLRSYISLRHLLKGTCTFSNINIRRKKIGLSVSSTILTKFKFYLGCKIYINMWRYILACQGFILKSCSHCFEMTISSSDDSFLGYYVVMCLHCYSMLFNHLT